METSPLICCANQWTGFYIIGTSAMKELSALILLINYDVVNFAVEHVKSIFDRKHKVFAFATIFVSITLNLFQHNFD